MIRSLTARVESVVDAAKRIGVCSVTPRVLHDGYNLVVHLAPTPVVARVMTPFPDDNSDDAAHWFGAPGREVALAEHLVRCGVPVVGPVKSVDPGPHRVEQTCFTLWALATPRPGERPSPAEFSALLSNLRAGLASYPGDLPRLGAWMQTPRPPATALRTGVGDPESALWLERVWDILQARMAILQASDLVPAHGDTHVGNLLWAEPGWVWCDFEDASLMPRYWDLACAVFRAPLLGEDVEWSTEVQRLTLGAATKVVCEEEFTLALAVRTVQSVSGGLALSTLGLTASDSVLARLAAARPLLRRLGLA